MARAVSVPAFDPLSTGLIDRDRTCTSLTAFLAEGRLPSLLFAGPESSGKRTLALRLAQAANCAETTRPCGTCRSCRTIAALGHPDVRVLFPARKRRRKDDNDDPASAIALMLEQSPDYALDRTAPPLDPGLSIPVDAIRWVRREMSRPPFSAARRFFIILHAERMTTEAANAFLKTLEEPQQQSALVLTTSAPSMLPDTIRSRCRFIRFPAVAAAPIRDWLIAEHDAEPAAAALAAEFSGGSPGRALRFLTDPDEHLDPVVVDFFVRPQDGEDRVFSALDALGRTPLPTITASFLFLLDQALRVRHELPTCYAAANPDLVRRARMLPDDYLRRAIRYVTERLDEARLSGINRRLFLYTLLASLRHAA